MKAKDYLLWLRYGIQPGAKIDYKVMVKNYDIMSTKNNKAYKKLIQSGKFHRTELCGEKVLKFPEIKQDNKACKG